MQINEIFNAIKKIAIQINEILAYEDTNYTQNTNSTGDTQLALDVKSDIIIQNTLKQLTCIKQLISEEQENAFVVNENANLIIGYDPLDGSSLVDVNLSVGSIFGIYKDDINGQNLIASAYIVYGPRVELVLAYENVKLYRLNKNNDFDFVKNIILQEKGKLNAPGGTQQFWSQKHKNFIDSIFKLGYRLRYSGGMVPDLHQILLKGGGLFSYPSTDDAKNGKLRKVFEVFPFAFIFQKANGYASDGMVDILSLKTSHLHDTTPCFFGSKFEMQKLKEAYGSNA